MITAWRSGEVTRWTVGPIGDDMLVWTTAAYADSKTDRLLAVAIFADKRGVEIRTTRAGPERPQPGAALFLRQRVWFDAWLANRREQPGPDPIAEVAELAWQHVDRLRANSPLAPVRETA